MAYGTPGGVAAFVPRYANAAGVFDSETTPAAADVATWLAQISAMLDVALSGHGVDVPVTEATVTPMLDGYANAQAAAVARGVNGQGRFAERQASADEMLIAIGGDAAEWVSSWVGGIGALLGVTTAAATATVSIGRFTRVDGYSSDGHEYTV